MADYIPREAAVLSLLDKGQHSRRYKLGEIWELDFEEIREAIKSIPAADVVTVRHGRWIWDKDGMDWNIGAWRCSECRARSPMWWDTDRTSPHTKSGHRYCPNCGADMREES